MIRFLGINISDKKQVWLALTYIYGIGKSLSINICNECQISLLLQIKDLSNEKINILRNIINKYIIEGDLKKDIRLNIKRLIDLNCYRGIRHKRGLPVRGQRTRTNSRTVRKLKFIK